MIRDRIVVGLLDHTLSEKLQLDSDLTFRQISSTKRSSEEATACGQRIITRGDDGGANTAPKETSKEDIDTSHKSRVHTTHQKTPPYSKEQQRQVRSKWESLF